MLESFFWFGWGGWGRTARTARAHVFNFSFSEFNSKQPVITGWCPLPRRGPAAGDRNRTVGVDM